MNCILEMEVLTQDEERELAEALQDSCKRAGTAIHQADICTTPPNILLFEWLLTYIVV